MYVKPRRTGSLPNLDRLLNRPTDDCHVTTIQAVELGVLGPLQARRDGASVTIPGAKPRAILTMLGLHGGSVVSADTLIDLLWGDEPPRTAAKALQTHISSLRRALGDGFVLTEGTGWILNTAEVDAPRYKRATKAGRDAAATGDSSQAVARFEDALSLWRGTPELPDSRRGISEKTRWIEGHAALVEDRADALLATGRVAEIIGELEAAVADAPLRERRWAQLMLALYRAGRQGDALGAYQRARSLLADELGVDPGPELRRLAGAIVAQDSALDHPVIQHVPSVTRAVTFLLTDIEGSTAAWEAQADAMGKALARHDELVEQVVTSRGGRLIKTRGEGDATFSVFDRPSAAAAAAIELQDAILHEPWALHDPMRIRIALHTGEVELRDGDYFGRAVNRAARLRSLAAGGQILCSGATAELVVDTLPDDVALADLGMRALRNLPRPEHVFELRLQSAEQVAEPVDEPLERPDLPAVLTVPGRFVGRGLELDRLAGAWQTTLAGGIHAMLIAGEPGVGKTRLAGEWSRQAFDQGAVVLYGRSDEDLGAPYQPFAEALRTLVPCVNSHRLRGLRGVEALLPLIPGLTEVLPDLSAPPRADPDTERYALFDAVVALLELASASAPVMLILDDLHWAAKPTLLLLRHLLRFGDHTRVQIVATYRSTDLDRSHPLAAMLADLHRDGTADRLALSGLDAADVTAYVAEAGYDDEQLARALAAVTGGNPFFLIQVLRHVDESGGVWDPNTLPQGVREAVSRRLSRLPAETNKALAAAAVVGSSFAVDLVERVVERDLVDAFDEACKAGIIIEEAGGRYRFNHAIVRQALIAELASVRRMRLHQRIATTLEATPGADEELLGELAYHYFECAWAGNAAKAVEYCRRAADQAMTRLAYEGAADLYDQALHALEEIDDELPDRADQTADLLVARCEALLAAGDMASATHAVSQLQAATVDSARLSAWATCFDGQLSMLVHPERLDEIEAALSAAAVRLAGLGDAEGEAKAHTVRAGCLARLGRIGDCETALDSALTAARHAREHRRVNAVLAGAPLAALWGPNPVPRAGGRCLDVVRLLRITTDSPAVEAISTRCQAVLEAFRGRPATARRMIDSARRTVTEIGLRHALLEVEQFAGIIELVGDEPGGAEPHLRQAYQGFRRMGLDADTAETAALLGRACLALDRDDEAEELCTESERLSGHALKASIAWRTLRALLLTRRGDHPGAQTMAESAVALAERTDALVDHGDACLALATVLHAAGDTVGARAAAERASGLYERKGAEVLAAKAQAMLGERAAPASAASAESSVVEVDNACVRAGEHVEDRDAAIAEPDSLDTRFEAVRRVQNKAMLVIQRFYPNFAARDWKAIAEAAADNYYIDDRRRTVNTGVRYGRDAGIQELQATAEVGFSIIMSDALATRGERLVLTRVQASGPDPEAVHNDALNVIEIDSDEKVVAAVVFDVDGFDAAIAELDARYQAGEAADCAEAWSTITTAFVAMSRGETPPALRGFTDIDHRGLAIYIETVHRLTDRGAVITHVAKGISQDGSDVEWRMVDTLMVDGGLISHCEMFDEADLDTALARFDALQSRKPRRLHNMASQVSQRFIALFAARDWDAMADIWTDDYYQDDHRSIVNAGIRHGRDAALANMRAVADLNITGVEVSDIATRGERLILTRSVFSFRDQEPEAFVAEQLDVGEFNAEGRLAASVSFDPDDFEAALAELDARYLAGEAAPYARTWSALTQTYAAADRQQLRLTPDCVNIDHRRIPTKAGGLARYLRASWDEAQSFRVYVEAVHRLGAHGAVFTQAARGVSDQGFEAEWREVILATVEGDLVNRCEVFDEADLDAALARFDELGRSTPALENAATRNCVLVAEAFNRRDGDAIFARANDDGRHDDRRKGLRSVLDGPERRKVIDATLTTVPNTWRLEVQPIAVRGSRLSLTLDRYRDVGDPEHTVVVELLHLMDVDTAGLMQYTVTFDVEDIDAAFAELENRYLAGEGAAYAQTWSLISDAYVGFNRREVFPTTPDWISIDHRRGAGFDSGDMVPYIKAAWADSPDTRIYIASVHRLSQTGAVVTHVAQGISQDGFEAEWRDIQVLTVDGELVNRSELFDGDALHAALARFDELS